MIDLATIRLNGKAASVDIRQAITSLDIERTIDGASTVTIRLSDPRRALVRSQLFRERSTLSIDRRLFELVAPRKNGDDLELIFEDALIAELRRTRGVLRRGAGVATDAFARLLVPASATVVAERRLAPAGLHRGGDDAAESSWEALSSRIAADRGWRCFVDGNTVYLGSDAFLLGKNKAMPIRERVGAVDDIDFDADAGKPSQTATMNVRAQRWTLGPGAPVEVMGLGVGAGPYMVASVSQSAFADMAQVQLIRRQVALPEPKPEPRDDGQVSTGAAAVGGGSAVSGPVSARGFAWPLTGPISSGFGQRSGRLHAGLDIAVPIGTPVGAARAGTVITAGPVSGYGNAVYLDHGSGLISRYGHLDRVLVRRGQTVALGERIALSGNTGNSTGPHLHLEIRSNGTARNPRDYLPAR